MSTQKPPKLCLVDASGYIHRAYHALPLLTNSQGQPVNAVYGFSRMMGKVLKEEKPDYLGVCFDTPKPTFRHELSDVYKATRVEIDEALISQFPLVEEMAKIWGLPCIKMEGFEADDVIATLAISGQKAGCNVLILSGDKDILQLISPGISVRDEIRKVDYTAERVFERFGVHPHQLIDYFSLMGDKVDNVAGVPGVGEKTAAKLLDGNKTLEVLYQNLDGLKPALKEKLLAHRDVVFGNRQMIKLRFDVPISSKMEDLKPAAPDSKIFSTFLQKMEFKGELPGVAAENQAVGESNTKRKVMVVKTESELASLEKNLKSSDFISYDLETDSADEHHCQIVGVALSIRPNEAWYIPVGHRSESQQLPWSQIKTVLKPLLENTALLKVGQNLKFDNAIMRRFDVFPVEPFFDTMIASYCLDPVRGGYGLKDMAGSFLNEKMTRIEELIGKKNEKTMVDVPVDQAAPYAGADAEVVVRLKALFEERLKKEGLWDLFQNLEMPLVDVLRSMEEAGIRVDLGHLQFLEKDLDKQKKKLEEEIYGMAGETFLLNSPQQLSRILFEKLKLPTGKKTKTGFSTNEEVLRKLAEKHPICEKIISYRELAKMISTYVLSLIESRDPLTSRVHTSFHQTGTATGRLSSTDPNLQNIPIRSEMGKNIRRTFIAEPGYVLLSADYSQIDLRSLAHMSEDPVLIETFKKGGDIHAATAAEVFHVSLADVTQEQRRRAKAINFGVVYGQQAWGLSQSLGITPEEANNFIQRYFERYAHIKSWMERTLDGARKNGFVETLSGRRRGLPDILAENMTIRGFAERIAINTPIQGTSSDIIKIAMINLHRSLAGQEKSIRMLVQVHDELLFEVAEKDAIRAADLIRAKMEQSYVLKVPLVVDIKVGQNWTDMTKLAVERAA